MVCIIYQQYQAQKLLIGAQVKFVFKMKLKAKKISQVLVLMNKVIIVKVSTFYQLSEIKVPEFTSQKHNLVRKGLEKLQVQVSMNYPVILVILSFINLICLKQQQNDQ